MCLSDLVRLDWYLSLAVNGWHSDWADVFMKAVSGVWIWVPLYALLIGLMVCSYRKSSWIVILGAVLLVGLADWTSVHFFKDVFMRLRPSHEPALEGLIRVPFSKGGLYGFVSSHAVNCFAIAAYATLSLRKRFPVIRYGILFLWASLVGYSRIYLGRHYLGDVVCGALWGILLAVLVWFLIRSMLSRAYPSAYRCRFRQRKK